MKLKAINTSDTTGTSLKGYINISRRDLNTAFGAVDRDDTNDKVQYEWNLLFEVGGGYGDVIATIYDYKEESDIALDSIHHWHVGGNSPLAVACVYMALGNRGGFMYLPKDFPSYKLAI